MFEMDKKIIDSGILAVIQLENIEDSVPLAQALVEGGISTAEITFRNPEKIADIAKIISNVRKNVPQLFIGGATVTSPEIAKVAVDSGAQFIISAGFKSSTVEYCINNKVPVYPGIATPSEIEVALDYNLSILKFFPAEVFGGTAALKAFAGPYSHLKFIVTGGINQNNAEKYFACNNVASVSGSWITPKDLILQKKWNEIKAIAQQTVQLKQKIKGE